MLGELKWICPGIYTDSPYITLDKCMLISFFLFETFKEDVTAKVIPITSYATSVRRKIVDIAAKIVGVCSKFSIDVAQFKKCDHLLQFFNFLLVLLK